MRYCNNCNFIFFHGQKCIKCSNKCSILNTYIFVAENDSLIEKLKKQKNRPMQLIYRADGDIRV